MRSWVGWFLFGLVVIGLYGWYVLAAPLRGFVPDNFTATANAGPAQAMPTQGTTGISEFTVDVQSVGTGNTLVRGGCLTVAADGSTAQATEEKLTPATFSYKGRSVSCSFQDAWGTVPGIKMTISRGGIAVKQVETRTLYGVVAASI